MKNMYIYIMTNFSNSTLYIGVTNNLVRRIYEHREKLIDGFTKKYNLNKLVYYECFDNEIIAIEREKFLKKAYHKTKVKLITDFNPEWQDLWPDISKG